MSPLILLLLVAFANTEPDLPAVALPGNLDRLDPAVVALVQRRAAEVAARPRDAAAHGELALVYEANGLWDEAKAAFEIASRLDPAATSWRFHLALARRESSDLDGALDLFRSLAAEAATFPALEQRLGEALLETGDLDGAKAAFRRLIELLPEEPDGYVGLGDVLQRQGDLAAALAELERAVAMAPGYRIAHYLLGTTYARLGRREEAEGELKKGAGGAFRYLPDRLTSRVEEYAVNLTARLDRAGSYLGAGRPAAAAELLEAAREHHSENVTLLNNLAVAYLRLGRPDDAERVLEKARGLDPAKFSTYLNLASWALRAGRLELALAHADSAVARAPDLAAPRFTRAQVLARSGRYEDALASLAQSLERDAGNPRAMAFSGDLCRQLERLGPARDHYRKALAIDPELLPALIGLARTSAALGDPEAAMARLEEARSIAPGHPLVARLERDLEAADR